MVKKNEWSLESESLELKEFLGILMECYFLFRRNKVAINKQFLSFKDHLKYWIRRWLEKQDFNLLTRSAIPW